MADMKRMLFDVDARQISIKKLLKKDFLELSMKAISSACPNRNNSWFTRESMEKSLYSFKNKPILGAFDNGDFVSHNGEWEKDQETGMTYWDTLGSKGERPLGVIRDTDEVKIIEEDGLSWVTLTCVLWTQYSFKQVKRLLKDAMRSNQDGTPTKNISVEVDLLDYEELDNGIIKINEFSLTGITILGSRNGRKVEPGIAGAELSVLDMVDKEQYEKQIKALRVAYEKLDEMDKKEEKKEASTLMENEDKKIPSEIGDGDGLVEHESKSEPEKEPETEMNSSDEGEKSHCDDNDPEDPEDPEDDDDGDDDPDDDDHDDDDDKKEPAPEEEGKKAKNELEKEEDKMNSGDTVFDLMWLHTNFKNMSEHMEYVRAYYSEVPMTEELEENRSYILDVLDRIKKSIDSNKKEVLFLVSAIAEKIPEELRKAEEEWKLYADEDGCLLSTCEHLDKMSKDLEEKCSCLSKEKEEIECKLDRYESKDFLEKAQEIISSADLTEDQAKDLFQSCIDGKYEKDIQKVNVDVALMAFENAKQAKKEKFEKASYSTSVIHPSIPGTPAEGAKRIKDSVDILREYNKK